MFSLLFVIAPAVPLRCLRRNPPTRSIAECEVQRTDQVQIISRTSNRPVPWCHFWRIGEYLIRWHRSATGAGDSGNIASTIGGALEVLVGTFANFTKARQEFIHPHNHLSQLSGMVRSMQGYFQRGFGDFLRSPMAGISNDIVCETSCRKPENRTASRSLPSAASRMLDLFPNRPADWPCGSDQAGHGSGCRQSHTPMDTRISYHDSHPQSAGSLCERALPMRPRQVRS